MNHVACVCGSSAINPSFQTNTASCEWQEFFEIPRHNEGTATEAPTDQDNLTNSQYASAGTDSALRDDERGKPRRTLAADVVEYGALIKQDQPTLPLFLLGHSMGSFASQSIIIDDSDQHPGVVLSGSTALDALAAGLAAAEGPAGLEAFNAGFEHRTAVRVAVSR